MRNLKLALLVMTILGAASAVWAAGPAPAPESATPASSAASVLFAPAAVDGPLMTPAPVPAFSFCPHPPVDSCDTCYIHTFPPTQSTHMCTLFCYNGVPKQVCQPCGEAC